MARRTKKKVLGIDFGEPRIRAVTGALTLAGMLAGAAWAIDGRYDRADIARQRVELAQAQIQQQMQGLQRQQQLQLQYILQAQRRQLYGELAQLEARRRTPYEEARRQQILRDIHELDMQLQQVR